jgi:hypothetical protein
VKPGPACRAFEERLVELADLSNAGRDPHVAGCDSCRLLVHDLLLHQEVFARLVTPQPPPGLLRGLLSVPVDLHERAEAQRILSLLSPGSLAPPEPSRELLSSLAFLPARQRARLASSRPRAPAWRRLLLDWRAVVVGVYAAAAIFIGAFQINPLSVARNAASSVQAAGGKAVVEAQTLAQQKLVPRVKPMTDRLDYKLYRTVAASRARAVAYAQLAFEKVLGGSKTVADTARPTPRARPEPSAPALRS